jgi:nicotinamidase-related amidase
MEVRVGKALMVIDEQNYFPGGNFPLRNTDATLEGVGQAMARACDQGVPVVLVQHVAAGPSSNAGNSQVMSRPPPNPYRRPAAS